MDSEVTTSYSLHSFGFVGDSRCVVLAVTFGDETHARTLHAGESLCIGRGDQADLSFTDPGLSRRHARFSSVGTAVVVEDLGSHNGTRLNGARIRRAELTDGDRVTLGRVVVTVHGLSVPARVTPLSREEDSPAEGMPVRSSPAMQRLHERIVRLAAWPLPVLIVGETGTGKELVARELHRLGPGGARPMVVVNCAAIPAQLIESVLFGHVRGAFTGADRAHVGVFQSAQGGTVFLDEIGELAMPVQAALLRVLESHRVQPIGATRDAPVEFRAVAATHRDLPRMVQEHTFREDLYHRLNGVTLEVPPLRDRREEIVELARHFLRSMAARQGVPERVLSNDALSLLASYAWPGNVRELRNVIEHAVALSDGDPIGVEALPPALRCEDRSGLPDLLGSRENGLDFRSAVRGHEAELIRKALARTGGNQRKAAGLLGLPLRTLERKLQRLDTPSRSSARARDVSQMVRRT